MDRRMKKKKKKKSDSIHKTEGGWEKDFSLKTAGETQLMQHTRDSIFIRTHTHRCP